MSLQFRPQSGFLNGEVLVKGAGSVGGMSVRPSLVIFLIGLSYT